jgi:hypothetical protein
MTITPAYLKNELAAVKAAREETWARLNRLIGIEQALEQVLALLETGDGAAEDGQGGDPPALTPETLRDILPPGATLAGIEEI